MSKCVLTARGVAVANGGQRASDRHAIGTLEAALWRGSRARLRPIGVDREPGAALRCGLRAWWGAPSCVDRWLGCGPWRADRERGCVPSVRIAGRGGGPFMCVAGPEADRFAWIAASGATLAYGSLARRPPCVAGGRPGCDLVTWIAGPGTAFLAWIAGLEAALWCGSRARRRPVGLDRRPGGRPVVCIAGPKGGPLVWIARPEAAL